MQMVLCIIELKECVIKHIDTINTHILEILCWSESRSVSVSAERALNGPHRAQGPPAEFPANYSLLIEPDSTCLKSNSTRSHPIRIKRWNYVL